MRIGSACLSTRSPQLVVPTAWSPGCSHAWPLRPPPPPGLLAAAPPGLSARSLQSDMAAPYRMASPQPRMAASRKSFSSSGCCKGNIVPAIVDGCDGNTVLGMGRCDPAAPWPQLGFPVVVRILNSFWSSTI
ncbi:hypothetical protein GUJ93_ZPchr0006g41373 [Zizania palustris]|uniref:Uncharacterized protein n=1 Tax=Zizania palustris TaxID=103762 RepID=A0A8J5SNV1_ZIZPA|nr:hypothetical protein GUJ93_ZPchr0006g41373 [Zizania palustris]